MSALSADRVVLVTGAGRGIGRVIAEAFLRERSVVVGLDVEIGALGWLTPGNEERAAAYACDVRDLSLIHI